MIKIEINILIEIVMIINNNKLDNKATDFLFLSINEKKESVDKIAIENVVKENKTSSKSLKESVIILL